MRILKLSKEFTDSEQFLEIASNRTKKLSKSLSNNNESIDELYIFRSTAYIRRLKIFIDSGKSLTNLKNRMKLRLLP